MKLALLGTTGYHPSQRRHTACFAIPEIGLVLDAGSGMFRLPEYLSTPTLDIFLSHAHLDHVIGLTYLFDVMALARPPLKRVTVHAEADKLAAIETHLLASLLFPVPLPCEYRPLAGPCQLGQGGRLSYFPLEHPGGSVGFRLDWPGHSLAYVTDTTARPDASYIAHLQDVDLLVHEAYFADGMQEMAVRTGHSWASGAAEVARRANVGRLVLVHLNPATPKDDAPNLAAAKRIFPAVELGEDGMEIEF